MIDIGGPIFLTRFTCLCYTKNLKEKENHWSKHEDLKSLFSYCYLAGSRQSSFLLKNFRTLEVAITFLFNYPSMHRMISSTSLFHLLSLSLSLSNYVTFIFISVEQYFLYLAHSLSLSLSQSKSLSSTWTNFGSFQKLTIC